MRLDIKDRKNKLQQVLSPSPDDAGVWIHQTAWFHMAQLDAEKVYSMNLKPLLLMVCMPLY